MEILKKLFKLTLPHTREFIFSMICMGIVAGATGASAYLMKPVFDDVFLNKDGHALVWIAVAVIVIFFLKGAGSYGQTVLMSMIGQRIITDMRRDLYSHIQKQPLSFFTKSPTGVLISRITNDVTLIQGAVSEAVTSLVKDSFTIVGLVVVVFYQDWKLAILAMTVFPLTIYPIAQFSRKMRSIANRTQVTMGSLTSLLQETISGNRIVKAFGMEHYENERFAKENERLFKLTMKSVSIRAVSSPFMEFLGGIGIAAVIFYGGSQVIRGASTPGTFMSFITALLLLYEPIKRLTNVNNTIQQGLAGAERIYEVINTVPEILNKKNAVPLPRISKAIEIRDVSFRYEDTFVLKDINLNIRAGEVVAFVGMSGGGKTTLVNLIPRFYDVTEGQILIDALPL